MSAPRRSQPARRVYHDRDDTRTTPDRRLPIAFESTSPSSPIVVVPFEDEPTVPRWVLPAFGGVLVAVVAGVISGVIVERWKRREAKRRALEGSSDLAGTAAVVDESGFDLLGAE